MRMPLRRFLPAAIKNLYAKAELTLLRRANKSKSLQEVFEAIYADNKWGGTKGQYCSGTGSNEEHASLYATAVKALIAENGIRTVLDLGCGDFAVARRFQAPGLQYVGADIVEGLVRYNQEHYSTPDISFRHLNIVSEELPDAELCLVRQVLQHLSNSEVGAILAKLRKYKFVLITEHYPAPSITPIPNLDKPHGSDTRIYDDSAIYLDRPPFNITVERVILDVDAGDFLVHQGERIKTFLVRNFTPA